jgi:hypothetical protein
MVGKYAPDAVSYLLENWTEDVRDRVIKMIKRKIEMESPS